MRKNYNKKLKYILYCYVLFSCMLQAERLEEVLKENIYTNPQVRSSVSNYQFSLHELEKVNAGYKPTLDVSTEYGKERTEVASSFRGVRELNENQSRIVGRYNIFEGFKTTYEIEEKKSAVKVAKNKAFQKVDKISSFIIQVYLEVLRQKKLLLIENENVQNHVETLEKVKLRLEAGDGYESDLRQTKARVTLAKTNQLIIHKQYKNSEINYRRFMGKVPVVSSMISPSITFLVHDSEIDSFVKEAQKANYLAKIQSSEIAIAKSVHKQQGSRYYPTLDLEVSKIWSDNVHGFEGQDDSSKVALVLNYNFYNGGADRASQLASLRKSEMSLYGLDDIKLGIEEQVRILLMKYKMLESQEELIVEQLAHLQGTRELYEIEYQNNKRTIIDVLNIKQEYTYAQSQKTNVHYDKMLTYYQFKSSMGRLVQEFNLDDVLERR